MWALEIDSLIWVGTRCWLPKSPTVAGLAVQIEELLHTARGLEVPPLRPVPRDGELPLTFSQERMWVVQQIQPNTSAYNIPVAIRLSGSLNVTALKQALDELVRRHEILRTTISLVNGRPGQRIGPPLPLDLQLTDLSAYPVEERQAMAFALCKAHAMEPFDLASGPLLRAHLFRYDAAEHIVLVTMHHAIADAWSIGVAAKELSSLYVSFALGEPSQLPQLAIQYADYAHWQRTWFQGSVLDAQRVYWKRQLSDVSVLSFPTDRPRPVVQTSQGAQSTLTLDDALLESLRTLSHKENATLFMTLLATFKVLLHRYSGQTDVVVGVPIANRHWLDSEPLLGTLVNTVVMRTSVDGELTFRELLTRVRKVALEAYANQDLPFERLVTAMAPRRDLSHSPLFQVLFDYTNVPLPHLELPGLTWQPMNIDRGSAQFDFTLAVVDTDYLRQVAIEYNTDLFDAATIDRMLAQYQNLLRSVVADPDQRIAQLAILSEPEQQQLLVAWNDTALEYPRDACLHQLIEAQTARTPDAVAVSDGASQLTYRELQRLAEGVALRLRSIGAGPDVPVGICVPRSLDMMIGLLAILRAGSAYVPLDPSFPEERLRTMLVDSQMPVLLDRVGPVRGSASG